MLNSYETQRAGKTNKGHRFAAKKNVLIVVIRFSRYIDVKDPIGSKLLFLSLSAPEKEPIR